MVLDVEEADLEATQSDSKISKHPSHESNIEDDESKREQSTEISTHSRSDTLSIEPDARDEELQAGQEQISRISSAHSRPPAIVVRRGERRGLFANLSIIPEVTRPYDYKNKTKWLITLIVAIAAAAAPLGSAIFFPALSQVSADLHTTQTITNLSVALYMLSMSIFPLWWSSFSETLGRRTIYLVSFAMFTVWNIVAAKSSTIAMLIVMRILGGGAAASVQAVGAGTIADIWESRERGRAMGIFYLGPLLGPLLAPIIGGVLADVWGWRSTQWFQAIFGGVLFLLILFCLPETLAIKKDAIPSASGSDANPTLTRVSTRQSAKIQTKRAAKVFKRCIIDPLSVLAYLRFPAVLITVYLASITFGSLYVLNVSIQQTFAIVPYNFPTILVGLCYFPGSLGYIVASIFGGRWTDIIMHREARAAGRYDSAGKLILQPEDRMRENAWIAAAVFPGALVWYGWTAEQGVFWVVPLIANFFFGLGSMIIFGTSTTMLTEFMPRQSSSGVAVNNFVRNIFSCVGGIVAQPIITAIGNGWLFTILGLVSWISAFAVVFSMRKFGPKWRLDMDRQLK